MMLDTNKITNDKTNSAEVFFLIYLVYKRFVQNVFEKRRFVDITKT